MRADSRPAAPARWPVLQRASVSCSVPVDSAYNSLLHSRSRRGCRLALSGYRLPDTKDVIACQCKIFACMKNRRRGLFDSAAVCCLNFRFSGAVVAMRCSEGVIFHQSNVILAVVAERHARWRRRARSSLPRTSRMCCNEAHSLALEAIARSPRPDPRRSPAHGWGYSPSTRLSTALMVDAMPQTVMGDLPVIHILQMGGGAAAG